MNLIPMEMIIEVAKILPLTHTATQTQFLLTMPAQEKKSPRAKIIFEEKLSISWLRISHMTIKNQHVWFKMH